MIKRRQAVLGVILLATLLATYFAPPAADEVGSARNVVRQPVAKPEARPPEPKRSSLASDKSESILAIKKRMLDESELGAFEQVFWVPPVVVKPVAAVQEVTVPQAPPLPFKVIGKFAEGESEGAFLQYNDQNIVVRAGETIGTTYVVESYQKGVMTFLYTPLQQRQTLVIYLPD